MKKKIIYSVFVCTLLAVLLMFIISAIRVNKYNSESHVKPLTGSELFTSMPDRSDGASINIVARTDTWGKVFDINNEGLGEEDYNYFAHMYDFFVSNNTSDEVRSFKFKIIFNCDVYLSSAWNGSLEIHQNVNKIEKVDTIPDLRNFNYLVYDLDTYYGGETHLVVMHKGDYFIYIPNSTVEIPIKANEYQVPGIIVYTAKGETIEDSTIIFEYKLYRTYTSDIFTIIGFVGLGIWSVALIIFVITSLQIRKYRIQHERDNKIITESIETFTGFIDAKDPYTNGHSKRVAMYTKLLAKEMGYDGEELENIYYIGLLHDCGKIGVPDNILGKPGRLTEEEFEIIKSHTVRGGEILSNFKSLEDADEGARYHHERYDGKGYPEGLKGEEIPLIARIICVADSFDAMNSNRVYRKKLSKDYIISELENNKGTQFDPKIVSIMLELIKNGKVKIEE